MRLFVHSTPLNYNKKLLRTFTDYAEPTQGCAPVVRVACLVLHGFSFYPQDCNISIGLPANGSSNQLQLPAND